MKTAVKVFGVLIAGMVLFYITQLIFSEIEPFKLRFSISLLVYVSYICGVIIGMSIKIKH